MVRAPVKQLHHKGVTMCLRQVAGQDGTLILLPAPAVRAVLHRQPRHPLAEEPPADPALPDLTG